MKNIFQRLEFILLMVAVVVKKIEKFIDNIFYSYCLARTILDNFVYINYYASWLIVAMLIQQ